jgi:hypothetical protein
VTTSKWQFVTCVTDLTINKNILKLVLN